MYLLFLKITRQLMCLKFSLVSVKVRLQSFWHCLGFWGLCVSHLAPAWPPPGPLVRGSASAKVSKHKL